MELADVLRRRRMVRSFDARPVDAGALERILDAGRRAPSAGFTQGTEFVVLEGPEQTARYWDVTLPAERRDRFPWSGLLDAPVLVLVVTDPGAYVRRYAEPDKARTRLGEAEDRWPVPYWWVDAGMAAMGMLLTVVDEDLGALFFGVFENEDRLLRELGVPAGYRVAGTIAVGHPSPRDAPSGSPTTRARRAVADVVHRGHW